MMDDLDTSSEDRLVIDMDSSANARIGVFESVALAETAACNQESVDNTNQEEEQSGHSSAPEDTVMAAPSDPQDCGRRQYARDRDGGGGASSVKRCWSEDPTSKGRGVKRAKTHHRRKTASSTTTAALDDGLDDVDGGSADTTLTTDAAVLRTPSDDDKQVDGSLADMAQTRDASTWVRTVSTTTDPDCLGPCEPGTHVTLEGVVWNETINGLLVVNVTWRGKSYVGTLLDCTKHDWAPPRLCDSPENDSSRTPAKGGRNGKRNGTSKMTHSQSVADFSSIRNGSSKSGKKSKNTSNSNNLIISVVSDEDGGSQQGPGSVGELALQGPMSPILQSCPCEKCDYRYIENMALKFHQNACHLPSTLATAEGVTETDNIATLPDTTESAAPEGHVLLKEPPFLLPMPPEVETTPTEKTGAVEMTSIDAATTAPECSLPCTNADTSQQPNTAPSSCLPESVVTDGCLTVEQSQSLAQLFGVVSANGGKVTAPKQVSSDAPSVGISAVDLPHLEPTPLEEEEDGEIDREESAKSPAYSDISDDGAPVLEKQSDDNAVRTIGDVRERQKAFRKSSPQKQRATVGEKTFTSQSFDLNSATPSAQLLKTESEACPSSNTNHPRPTLVQTTLPSSEPTLLSSVALTQSSVVKSTMPVPTSSVLGHPGGISQNGGGAAVLWPSHLLIGPSTSSNVGFLPPSAVYSSPNMSLLPAMPSMSSSAFPMPPNLRMHSMFPIPASGADGGGMRPPPPMPFASTPGGGMMMPPTCPPAVSSPHQSMCPPPPQNLVSPGGHNIAHKIHELSRQPTTGGGRSGTPTTSAVNFGAPSDGLPLIESPQHQSRTGGVVAGYGGAGLNPMTSQAQMNMRPPHMTLQTPQPPFPYVLGAAGVDPFSTGLFLSGSQTSCAATNQPK